jgi:membrane associated rhomboid family serine protease
MFFPFHDDNPTERMPVVTFGIIAVNVAIFLWATQLTPVQRRELDLTRGFVPARVRQFVEPKPIPVPFAPPARDAFGRITPAKTLLLPPNRREIVVSLFTCMFLHAGLWHLAGNMWFLWLFGNNVEDRLGGVLFIVLYLGGGLMATGCHWLTDPVGTTPVIGASGAVAAVLGAYFITWPWARIHTLVFLFFFFTVVNVPAIVVLGVWFLGQLLAGHEALQAGEPHGVAWWAHVGGFLAGLVLMPLFAALAGASKRPRRADS